MSDTETTPSQQQIGEAICTALAAELEKLTLERSPAPPRWEDAQFSLKKDPALGAESLEGVWLDENENKLGSLVIHADGNFYAEYDVVQPHPDKPRWFIESVTAWGRGCEVKSELQLLPMPE